MHDDYYYLRIRTSNAAEEPTNSAGAMVPCPSPTEALPQDLKGFGCLCFSALFLPWGLKIFKLRSGFIAFWCVHLVLSVRPYGSFGFVLCVCVCTPGVSIWERIHLLSSYLTPQLSQELRSKDSVCRPLNAETLFRMVRTWFLFFYAELGAGGLLV